MIEIDTENNLKYDVGYRSTRVYIKFRGFGVVNSISKTKSGVKVWEKQYDAPLEIVNGQVLSFSTKEWENGNNRHMKGY